MDQQVETVRLVAVTANPSLVIGLTFLGRDWDVSSSDDGSDLPEVPDGDVLVVDLGSTAAGVALLEGLGTERPPAVIVGEGDEGTLEFRDRLVSRPYTLQDLAAEVEAAMAGPRTVVDAAGSDRGGDAEPSGRGDDEVEEVHDEVEEVHDEVEEVHDDPEPQAAVDDTPHAQEGSASGPGMIRSWADRLGRRSPTTDKPKSFSARQAPNGSSPPPPPPPLPGGESSAELASGNETPARPSHLPSVPVPPDADDHADEPLFAGRVADGTPIEAAEDDTPASDEDTGDASLLGAGTADAGEFADGTDDAATSTSSPVLDLTDGGPIGPPIPPPPPVGPRIVRASAPVAPIAPSTFEDATTGPNEPRVKRSLFASRRIRPEGGAEKAMRQRLAEVVSAGVELEQLCADVPLLRSLPALARAVIAEVHAELEADVAVFFEHTDDGYVSLASIGLTPHERTLVIPLDQPMLAEVDRSGGGLLIDPIEAAHAAVAGIAGAHTESFMVASIAAGPGRFGLLAVGRNEQLKTGDLDRLLELALEAGPGVATAQLLRRLGALVIAPPTSAPTRQARSYDRIH